MTLLLAGYFQIVEFGVVIISDILGSPVYMCMCNVVQGGRKYVSCHSVESMYHIVLSKHP